MRQLLDAGVAVGVGVDGSASNDCGSLLAETRLAYLLQRAQGTIEGEPVCAVRSLQELSLREGSMLCFHEFGSLVVGAHEPDLRMQQAHGWNLLPGLQSVLRLLNVLRARFPE